MNKKYLLIALAVGVAVSASTSLAATKLLSSADNVIAVGGKMKNNSSYPANEAPGYLTDQNPSTKYLNRGQAHTGFIVTPVYGATVIKSMQFNTANDAPERDPATYELYGTNDEIKSTDNSFGDQEEWTLISSGTLNLPAERLKASEFYSFENEVSYTSYRMIFPTLKGTGALMQIADVQFYEVANPDPEGAGDVGILSIQDYDSTIAIQPPVGTDSAYNTSDWSGSPPANAVDLNYVNRYANFAKTNVGLAIWPAAGLTKLESFNIYTFTNRASCDPMTYQLFGTLDFRQSADNSLGTNETWVLLGEGSLQTPEARSTWSPEVSVETDEYYRGYKLLFTSIRDAAASDAEVVHISEMQFYGLKEDLGIGEPLLIPGDIARPINATKDINYWTTNSSSKYPSNENPPLVIDGSVTTKYLNSGGEYTGFIVTPAEAAAVKSFKMWTANDATERDPDVYQIWGRNTDYTETDNGLSTAEGWTLIAEGAIALPTERNTEGPLVVVENSASYKHYRVIFPSLRTNGNSLMQLAEMQLYSDAEGTVGILAPGNPIIAVQASKPASHSGTGESPQHTIDVNTATKYYNGAGTDSGVIFLPMNSSTVVKAIELTTANDSSERDPASFILYGTNEEVVSPDFSRGNDETWEEIASGDLDLPESRKTKMLEPFVFENDKAYSAYKIIFPTIRGKDGEQEGIGLQFSEIQFYGDILEAAPVNLVSNLRGDFFIAVRSAFSPSSRYNNNPLESPAMALDGNVTTKYLNSGNYTNNLGMIVTPAAGKKAIQHMEFSTGNDFEGRDPSSYKLYGTDDPITSEDNSDGSAENWTLVAEGTLEFPSERQKTGYWVDLPAATPAFTSWKIVFPTIKGVDSAGEHPQTAMQFADIQFISPEYEYFLSAEDFSIAVGDYMSGSGYPAQEGPFAVADENIKVKYLNLGMERSGFIVTPTVPITPNALMFTTANDAVQRDPTSVEVYGTDDPITSLDNSAGIDEDWTLIAEGALVSDNFRYRNSGIVRFDNEVTYTSYKVLFPTVKNPATAGCMQLGEFYFFNLSDTPEPPITPPILNFAVVDGKLVLRWAVSSRAVLEVSTQAMGGTWTHAGVPQLDEGTYYYEVPMTEKTAYYRLVVSTDAQ